MYMPRKKVKDENEINLPDFSFLKSIHREIKPRTKGLTEIRAAYYSPFGFNYFRDLLNTASEHFDAIKFAGGSFTLYPPQELNRIIETAHQYGVEVSTGGFIEYVLGKGRKAVDAYISSCIRFGFDIIEISSGFISIPIEDQLKLIEDIQHSGIKVKAEIGIQFGAGGGTTRKEILAAQGKQDPEHAVNKAKRMLEAGAYMIMMESEGITENVDEWDTQLPAILIREIGLEKIMFEAADPKVFEWYIKNYGADVNLFVDHSQIIQLEAYRQGIWGTQEIWGRVVRY